MEQPLSLKDLEAICKMMQKYTIDLIELPNGVKIVKAIHLPHKARLTRTQSQEPEPSPLPVNYGIPDEILFKSSSAPHITLEDLDNFPSET